MIDLLVQWMHDDEPRPRRTFLDWPQPAVDHLFETGTVVTDGYLHSVICSACMTGHRASLKASPNGQRHYCPTLGWVYPGAVETVAYRTDVLAFGRLLAASIDLAPEHVRAMANSQLCVIGDVSANGADRTVFITRKAGTARDISGLAGQLEAAGSKYPGLILCAGEAPRSVRTKHGHEFFALREALEMRNSRVALDRKQITAWARDLGRSRRQKDPDPTLEPAWKEGALEAWQRLDQDHHLNSNAARMGRQVKAEMLRTGWKEEEIPEAKSISDHLRDLHRNAYPKASRRKT